MVFLKHHTGLPCVCHAGNALNQAYFLAICVLVLGGHGLSSDMAAAPSCVSAGRAVPIAKLPRGQLLCRYYHLLCRHPRWFR